MKSFIFILAIVVLSISANKCDFFSKKYQNDQFWLSVYANCHLYIVCSPKGNGKYTQVDQSCGDLYWNEEYLTCVENIPDNATCKRTDTQQTTVTNSTYIVKCNFVVNPNNNAEFKPKDTVNNKFTVYQSCAKYFYFSLEKCTCLKNVNAPANTCDNRSFLNFNFDGNFDDSSCTNAHASVVKGFVGFEDHLQGKAAVFNGNGYIDIAAMRNIFAGNYITEFSISMFFLTDNTRRNELFFDNGNVNHDVSILLGYVAKQRFLSAQVKVSGGFVRNRLLNVILPLKLSENKWQHIAYVYKNGNLTLTLNGNDSVTTGIYEATNKTKVKYTIDNMDEPLSIGGRSSGHFFFNGMMDEFRVFKRALSPAEVIKLADHSF